MQCMEVWGGNQPVNCGVVMAGLDAWVYSRPYGDAAAGGDVHYVSSCATGRITRLLLADVSGHGDPVARTAAGLRNLMRQFVNFIDQTRFVRRMNEQFTNLDHAGLFATAVVTTYFAPTSELAVCNAGHPPPLRYCAASGRWTVLEARSGASSGGTRSARPAEISNTPLGIIERVQYEQFATRLAVGDLVLCYTDALSECRGADGQMLGTRGLLELVQSIDLSDPAEFVPAVLAALEAMNPTNLKEDDVTALLFRVNGLAPKLTLRDKAHSLYVWFRAMLGALRPGGPPAPWPELSFRSLGRSVFANLPRP
ncbi:MAG: serine/threonine-protein phosphatase [Phycisphaerae bacterium]|nr:serine/threonine-protein phosphatase [Phycisphaerae bacterium]